MNDDWFSRLWDADPEAAALVELWREIEDAEYAELLAEGRAKWGPDHHIAFWQPACTDPAYRGVFPDGWRSKSHPEWCPPSCLEDSRGE